MSVVLFKISLVRWVRSTIEKMNITGKDDSEAWSNYWFQTYKELGGQSDNSGSKGCPKTAAYGLWWLGRISDSGMTFKNWAIEKINKELGKNAVYAVLALDLLKGKRYQEGAEEYWTKDELWAKVQELYGEELGESPAKSEQGAIRVAMGLFEEGQILSKP